jgi:hypothetical protein
MAKFRYYNRDEDGVHRNNCVTRALSLASGMSMGETRRKLRCVAILFDCAPRICMSCYKHLIENVLYYKPLNCDGMTVGEFADMHPQGTYLVRMEQHISIIIDNIVYDTFNCLDNILTNAWEVR